MTREDFETIDGPVVIMLADGRMGLCNHWNDAGVQVDIYGDGPHSIGVIELPWSNVGRAGNGVIENKNRESRL
jgi:hypothetical protein